MLSLLLAANPFIFKGLENGPLLGTSQTQYGEVMSLQFMTYDPLVARFCLWFQEIAKYLAKTLCKANLKTGKNANVQ